MVHVPGDKRYPEKQVALEHDDYDVMCLDKMHHEKLLLFIRQFMFLFLGQSCLPGLGFCVSV